jgi:hypothetical protein
MNIESEDTQRTPAGEKSWKICRSGNNIVQVKIKVVLSPLDPIYYKKIT